MITCDANSCINNNDGNCSCNDIVMYCCSCDSYKQKLLDKNPKEVIAEILDHLENREEAIVLKTILFNDIDNIIDWDLASKTIVKYLS